MMAAIVNVLLQGQQLLWTLEPHALLPVLRRRNGLFWFSVNSHSEYMEETSANAKKDSGALGLGIVGQTLTWERVLTRIHPSYSLHSLHRCAIITWTLLFFENWENVFTHCCFFSATMEIVNTLTQLSSPSKNIQPPPFLKPSKHSSHVRIIIFLRCHVFFK